MQLFNNILKFKLLSIFLILKIMKKQLLLSVMAVMFTLTSFGQALPGSAPRGVACVDDPLHPMAGKRYIYKAASNQAGNYTFWATKDQNFITTTATAPIATTTNIATRLTTPTDLLYASSNYATAAPQDTIGITWSDKIVSGTTATAPTFVAVNQDGLCTNNFKVWPISPIKAFTVDIKNIEDATLVPKAYDTAEDQCIDKVRGAKYAAGAMVYDYGKDTLYFEVIAANFTSAYKPTFTITGLMPTATAVQTGLVEWTYDNPATTPWTATTTWHAATDSVKTSATNTSNGVSIYARLIITNNNYEGINATPITLAVDGTNSVGDWDIVNNTVAAPTPVTCLPATGADQADAATQTLNPRPTVTPAVPATEPFITGNNVN